MTAQVSEQPSGAVFQVYGPDTAVQTDWLVLTGIPDDTSGTGRFVQHIVRDLKDRGSQNVRILCSPREYSLDAATMMKAATASNLLVLHPQFLGMAETIEVLERRAAAGLKSFYYILDSSFFCVASYNYVTWELQPCLRCLGGNDQAAKAMGCKPGPVNDPFGYDFTTRLRAVGATGQVVFLAQNRNHAGLARQQFGPEADIRIVGLWCNDWNGAFDAFESGSLPDHAAAVDVVFHGSHVVPAKGLQWLLQVAARTPNISYLLPVPPEAFPSKLPANIHLYPMSWETGLATMMRKSKVVIVPSLWSASIEGALAKSIAAARAVATVYSPTAFSSELPKGLIACLSPDLNTAATELLKLVTENWQPDPDLKTRYVRDFRSYHQGVVDRILPAVQPPRDAAPATPVPVAPPLTCGSADRVMRDTGLIRPAYPRRLHGQVQIEGKPLRFADLHGFFFQYRQIFSERLYAYEPTAPEPYILDCGAHIGLASLFFGQCYPGCTIDAFEADPRLACMAADNLKAFGLGRAIVHAKAVWVHDHGVPFASSGDDAGHVAASGEGGPTVPSVRLRDWITADRRVSLLKMDVEGAEYELFADCADALDRVDSMVVEVHHLADNHGRVGDILHRLSTAGFEYMLVDLQQAVWEKGRKPPFQALKTDKELVTVLAWRPSI